jgi:hypothetical protein
MSRQVSAEYIEVAPNGATFLNVRYWHALIDCDLENVRLVCDEVSRVPPKRIPDIVRLEAAKHLSLVAVDEYAHVNFAKLLLLDKVEWPASAVETGNRQVGNQQDQIGACDER